MKIYCVEEQKGIIPDDDVKKMVGYYEPQDPDGQQTYWEVTTCNGGYFICKTQYEAEVISSLEEIKAILVSLVQERENAEIERKKITKDVLGMMEGLNNPVLNKILPKFDDKSENGNKESV